MLNNFKKMLSISLHTNKIEQFYVTTMHNCIIFQAFTLAEVLITLLIIGIIASITIPTLVQNIQDYAMKQAWKKAYSTIAQAYERFKQDEGGDLSGYFGAAGAPGQAQIVPKLGNYLYYTKTCGSGTYYTYNNVCGLPTNPALVNFYATLSGQYLNNNNLNYGQFILNDGTQLFFRAWDPTYLLIWVDLNGAAKGPNTLGKDLFGASATKDKIAPMGATWTGAANTCNTTATTSLNGNGNGSDVAGAGCSAEYLSN